MVQVSRRYSVIRFYRRLKRKELNFSVIVVYTFMFVCACIALVATSSEKEILCSSLIRIWRVIIHMLHRIFCTLDRHSI